MPHTDTDTDTDTNTLTARVTLTVTVRVKSTLLVQGGATGRARGHVPPTVVATVERALLICPHASCLCIFSLALSVAYLYL